MKKKIDTPPCLVATLETKMFIFHIKRKHRGAVIWGEFGMFMNIKSKPKYKLDLFDFG